MPDILPVVEVFHSIQGEGNHAGRSAFFIRLAKCKVGCSWCDTKQSWKEDKHPKIGVIQLANKVSQASNNGAGFVVITGGEPLHHNLSPLCNAIRQIQRPTQTSQIPIHIETSGVDELSGNPDWITLSPKRHFPPLERLLLECDELKVIINERKDLLFAEEMAKRAIELRQKTNSRNMNDPLLFLQAGWENTIGHNLTYEYVKKKPHWRMSFQSHKWLGVL